MDNQLTEPTIQELLEDNWAITRDFKRSLSKFRLNLELLEEFPSANPDDGAIKTIQTEIARHKLIIKSLEDKATILMSKLNLAPAELPTNGQSK